MPPSWQVFTVGGASGFVTGFFGSAAGAPTWLILILLLVHGTAIHNGMVRVDHE